MPVYEIPSNRPSGFLLEAIHFAGRALQERFNRENAGKDSGKGFRWIKPELTYPAFDHFTFAFGNQVFPVFVELIREGVSLMQRKERDRLVEAAAHNRLVPCLCKMNLVPVRSSVLARTFGGNPPAGNHFGLEPVDGAGWNLWDARTNAPVDPAKLATDERIEMSEWELRNFAIKIVRDDLAETGRKVTSFCDVPEIDPQIWFLDEKGRECWALVRFLRNPEDDDFRKWVGYENKDSRLKTYDGFFAGVGAASAEPVLFDRAGQIVPLSKRFGGDAPLWRGDGMYVRYEGLKRIYVADP